MRYIFMIVGALMVAVSGGFVWPFAVTLITVHRVHYQSWLWWLQGGALLAFLCGLLFIARALMWKRSTPDNR